MAWSWARTNALLPRGAFRLRCSVITKPNLGIRVILTGDCKQGIVAWGDETASIPNLSLTPVDPDATVDPAKMQYNSQVRGKRGGVRPPRGGTGLHEGLCAGPTQRAKAMEDHLARLLRLGGFRGCPQNRLPTNMMKDCRVTEGRKEAQSRLLGLSEGLPTSNLVK